MLPAEGFVTASANAVATAASTALPPSHSTSTPTWGATKFWEATIPLRARVGAVEAVARAAAARTVVTAKARSFMIVPEAIIPLIPLLWGEGLVRCELASSSAPVRCRRRAAGHTAARLLPRRRRAGGALRPRCRRTRGALARSAGPAPRRDRPRPVPVRSAGRQERRAPVL